MTFTKKIISVVLCIVMTVSLMSVAASAVDSISAGNKYTVSIASTEEKSYSFIAPSDGIYAVNVKLNGNGIIMTNVSYNGGLVKSTILININQCVNDYIGNLALNEDCLYFCAEKGKEFDINLRDFSKDIDETSQDNSSSEKELSSSPVSLTFSVDKAEVQTLKMGGTYTIASDYEVMMFIPTADGYYNFRSAIGSAKIDPNVAIYDITGELDENDNNGYDGDLNFDLTSYLLAGHVYAIEAMANSTEENSDNSPISYTMTVSDGSKIKPESIKIVSYNFGDIFPGDTIYYDIIVVPSGAKYNVGELKITSSNEKVATAYYDSDSDSLCLDAIKSGKATITITDSLTGISASEKIKVSPQFILYFQNMLYNIVLFFTSIIDGIQGMIGFGK